MATYKVTFSQTIDVDAADEQDAYEKASEHLSEYRLSEANDVEIEEQF